MLSWDLRVEVFLSLGLLGLIFSLGWWNLRRRSEKRFANPWRLLSYWAGLVVLGVALMSPIDVLGSQLFYMHMIQHLLVVMVAPPLLLLANPFPFFLWGLPPALRAPIAHSFIRRGQVRQLLKALTGPGVVWMAFTFVYLGWHDASLYNLALRSRWAHDLEHITFFVSAVLFWWHVIGAGPRIHGRFPMGMRVAYLIAAIPPNMLAGIAIAFSEKPIYSYYTTVPRLWGLSVMYDQMLGGIIMWIGGSMMYIVAALILLTKLFSDEEHKPLLQVADWATEEAMIAPGLESRAESSPKFRDIDR